MSKDKRGSEVHSSRLIGLFFSLVFQEIGGEVLAFKEIGSWVMGVG